jgi:hypothetical protein
MRMIWKETHTCYTGFGRTYEVERDRGRWSLWLDDGRRTWETHRMRFHLGYFRSAKRAFSAAKNDLKAFLKESK